MTETLNLRLSNEIPEIARLAELVESFLEQHSLPPKVAFDLNLALDELLTNVISYGLPPDSHQEIAVTLSLATDGTLTAEVVDGGVAFDPFSEAKPPVLEGELDDRPIGGLGIYFVQKLMDEVAYWREDGSNHVRLVKRTR